MSTKQKEKALKVTQEYPNRSKPFPTTRRERGQLRKKRKKNQVSWGEKGT